MTAWVDFKASEECWQPVWQTMPTRCIPWPPRRQLGFSYCQLPTRQDAASFLTSFDWGSFKASSASSVADEGARSEHNLDKNYDVQDRSCMFLN